MDSFVIADALVVKDRSPLGVGETPTEVLIDWLDTLTLNDVDSVDDREILGIIFGTIFWDAGSYENKKSLDFMYGQRILR